MVAEEYVPKFTLSTSILENALGKENFQKLLKKYVKSRVAKQEEKVAKRIERAEIPEKKAKEEEKFFFVIVIDENGGKCLPYPNKTLRPVLIGKLKSMIRGLKE